VSAPRTVIIVGGGIAGIAAALRLAEAGVRVTLLETRKKLGGRATSFHDARTGLLIDNCQHVAMACCTNFLDLCDRLGVRDKLRWRRETYWVETGGRVSEIRPGILPAPAHFTRSVLAAAFLSASDKCRLAFGMNAVLVADRRRFASITFSRWLAEHRQPESLVRRFWSPIVVSACNLAPERVAASTALHVFQEGFLAHRDAAIVGVPSVPLVQLYDEAERAIAAAGGTLRLGCGVEWLALDRVRTTSGEECRADAVVCAVPPERAARIVDPALQRADGRFERLARITHSPILGVHLTFDRPVLPMHSAVLVERPTQWLFRKDDAGAHVHAVISAADEWMPLSEDEIARRVLDDLHACFPAARGATLLSSRPVKEKLATFAATPEVESLRPATTGPSGLVLAGDYVRTGWPATMEGAARSGSLAAAALLDYDPRDTLLPSLRPAALVRLLATRLPSRPPTGITTP
jgi:zeta-carotene desaturase